MQQFQLNPHDHLQLRISSSEESIKRYTMAHSPEEQLIRSTALPRDNINKKVMILFHENGLHRPDPRGECVILQLGQKSRILVVFN
jgi:hypothetical protein